MEGWVGANVFDNVQQITGEVYRDKEGRKTQKFSYANKSFFLKLHSGVGWGEIFKNLFQLRLPVVGASNEWYAIERLHELGLDTLEVVGFGERGVNPATRLSFLITRELTDTLSLAKYCDRWVEQPPPFTLKRALIHKVANFTKCIHEDGINHRDLYICHFLVDISRGINNVTSNNLRLFLVDLHRAQMRSSVPKRWLVKDVGSIYFSTLDIGLTKRDVYRFVKAAIRSSMPPL